MKIAVIGSGPSGWAAFQILEELGHEVSMIDAGLIDSPPSGEKQKYFEGEIGNKLYFGSDIPYRDFPHGPKLLKRDVNPKTSFAKGGLSLVWGATMLPYSSSDSLDWPFSISRLHKYYKKITDILPISGVSDGLDGIYGTYFSRRNIFQSERIIHFLERLSSTGDAVFSVGSSRLAVDTGSTAKSGCNYCNECLIGCPINVIWNSKMNLLSGKVINFRVISLKEADCKVVLFGVDFEGNSIAHLKFDKVFLATGPIETFRILAESKIVESKALLKDSSIFFLPLLASRKLGSSRGNSFSLSQCFLRLNSRSAPTSQFQLYEYSEGLVTRTRNVIPFGTLIPKWLLRFILRKFIFAIGYLDGANSSEILMNLINPESLELSTSVNGLDSIQVRENVKKSLREFSKIIRKAGLLPLNFLTQFSLPGEGVHYGSWLPMGKTSDLLGRPQGTVNVHVVDSSVLPSIAAGPITFTVMANAMRIAEESTL